MSIQAIARDLYRAQQKMDVIKKEIETASASQQESLKQELRMTEKEHAMIRRMLDGEKESGSFRQKFATKGLKW